VSYPSGTDARDIAAGQGVAESDLFTLVVREGHGPDAPSETFRNMTVRDGPQRFDLVLAASTLVRPGGAPPQARPDAVPSAVGHLVVDGLHLVAHDAATWVPGLSAEVSHPDEADPETQAEAERQGVDAADLFDLTFTVGGAQQPLDGRRLDHRQWRVRRQTARQSGGRCIDRLRSQRKVRLARYLLRFGQ